MGITLAERGNAIGIKYGLESFRGQSLSFRPQVLRGFIDGSSCPHCFGGTALMCGADYTYNAAAMQSAQLAQGRANAAGGGMYQPSVS
mgnify:CR=1 FL=1